MGETCEHGTHYRSDCIYCAKDERDKLRAEVAALRVKLNIAHSAAITAKPIEAVIADNVALSKRLAEAEAALTQYADAKNWGERHYDEETEVRLILWCGSMNGPDLAVEALRPRERGYTG